jgi:hypothetical protein
MLYDLIIPDLVHRDFLMNLGFPLLVLVLIVPCFPVLGFVLVVSDLVCLRSLPAR